jgi:hypothetical protein
MITFLNRKKLLTDISDAECNRVKEVLKLAKIEYKYKTSKSESVVSRMMDVSVGSHYAIPFSSKKDNVSFVHFIYVKRKDYKKAKKLCKI